MFCIVGILVTLLGSTIYLLYTILVRSLAVCSCFCAPTTPDKKRKQKPTPLKRIRRETVKSGEDCFFRTVRVLLEF